MANMHVSGWWVPGTYLEVLAVMSKADVRTACRKRWGKDWYKVHPVIKKARMTWAAQEVIQRVDSSVLMFFMVVHL